MSLVVIQTTIPGGDCKPFRISEVLDRVADTADEALTIAAIHVGGVREETEERLTVRWHATGGYWLVQYEPAAEFAGHDRALLM
jgi:hypothetical protein